MEGGLDSKIFQYIKTIGGNKRCFEDVFNNEEHKKRKLVKRKSLMDHIEKVVS